MGRKFYKTCDDLARELGVQDALELINDLEPKLIERQQQLIQIIRTKNYAEISRYAHKTKGSIRYYGTNILNDLLEKLINVEYNTDMVSDNLIETINVEFHIILNYWQGCRNK
jgi:hypothetical protein